MSKDIAEIKTKLSSQAEINTEMEVQKRVNSALQSEREGSIKKKQVNKGLSLQTISVAGGCLVIIVTFIFQLLNYIKN